MATSATSVSWMTSSTSEGESGVLSSSVFSMYGA